MCIFIGIMNVDDKASSDPLEITNPQKYFAANRNPVMGYLTPGCLKLLYVVHLTSHHLTKYSVCSQ